MCTCVFLLRQESFDMILVSNPSFYDGGVTPSMQGLKGELYLCAKPALRVDPYFHILALI
jgi:hypothetical protein